MGAVPCYSLKGGLYRKSKAQVYYGDHGGYLYPFLDFTEHRFLTKRLEVLPRHYVMDLDGVYNIKPNISEARNIIELFDKVEIRICQGPRNEDDLIDTIMLGPAMAMLSTGTMDDPDLIEKGVDLTQGIGLQLDLDSDFNVLGMDGDQGLFDLVSDAVEKGISHFVVMFWDGRLEDVFERGWKNNSGGHRELHRTFSYLLDKECEVMAGGPSGDFNRVSIPLGEDRYIDVLVSPQDMFGG